MVGAQAHPRENLFRHYVDKYLKFVLIYTTTRVGIEWKSSTECTFGQNRTRKWPGKTLEIFRNSRVWLFVDGFLKNSAVIHQPRVRKIRYGIVRLFRFSLFVTSTHVTWPYCLPSLHPSAEQTSPDYETSMFALVRHQSFLPVPSHCPLPDVP